MRKLLTCIILLFSTALMAQDKGQLYNEGTLYVSPATLMTAESDFINDSTGAYNNNGEVLLKGGFLNKGLAGFTLPGGLTRFEGYQIQQIAGNKAASYYNVLFKNAHAQFAFLLSDTMVIFGQADFTQGIVDNKNYDGLVIFEDTASHIHVGDQSYVEGKVEKTGSTDFVYPVGKKGYFRPAATLLAAGNDTTHFGGEYLWKNSDTTGYPHNQKEPEIIFIDDHEYWTVDTASAIKDSVFVQLTWRKVTTPDSIMEVAEQGSDKYRLVVVRWNEQAKKWVNEDGTKNTGDRTVTSGKVSGFGVFTLGLVLRTDTSKPVAHDDNSINNTPGEQVSIVVTVNDDPGKGSEIDPATVTLIPAKGNCLSADCKIVQVPGEGTWTADANGRVTFSPTPDFHGNPTPMSYTVKNKNGMESDPATITIRYNIDEKVFIPNGFTPNGDGLNDTWKVFGNTLKEIHLVVYNQYGQKIFETRDINEGWDGTYKGKKQPTGVYVYYAEITLQDGQEVFRKGSITVVR